MLLILLKASIAALIFAIGMKYISSLRDKEKVKMKRVGGEWKVVVTDKLYDVLTGKGK
ncbi:MAG: hypothetical protein PVG01_08990 [Desulfobacterales bacterium]|jgi:hypothetical protein